MKEQKINFITVQGGGAKAEIQINTGFDNNIIRELKDFVNNVDTDKLKLIKETLNIKIEVIVKNKD